MKSSATPLRTLWKSGAATVLFLLWVMCVSAQSVQSKDIRAAATPALPTNVWSRGHSNDLTGAKVAGYLAKLPLAFEPNQGQTSREVKYLARGARYNVFFTSSEAVLVLGAESRTNRGETLGGNPVDILRMRLAGANVAADLIGVDQLPGKSNYLIGQPQNWHTNIPNFKRILQQQVYPGIDISYHGTEGQLEEDFVVSPGSDPRAIRLAFAGAKTIHTNASRELMITLDGGSVTLRRPVAYQETNGSKRLVPANYALSKDGHVGFRLGDYDPHLQLVIDPILSYSTYLGGSNIDGANAIAVAPDNTAFITGGTYSVDFPTTHQLQPTHGGPDDFFRDAFVVKLSADGSKILYSTYIGGQFEDVGNGIAVDAAGDAYVTGTTDSQDFPVPVTLPFFNPECGGDGKCGTTFNPGGLRVRNGFVIKLNPEGTAPLYSGFIGYYEHVSGQSIAVDQNNAAYVTGQVGPYIVPTVPITPPRECPPPFPITGPLTTTPIPFCSPLPQPPLEIPGPTAAQEGFGGGATDTYLLKISATGNTILYSTYLGGSSEDVGLGVAADAHANAYVTGLTYSLNFPVTGGALQGASGAAGDAFFAKVDTFNGGPLLYSSYLGGSGLDQGNSIAVDSSGNAYIAGTTASTANTLGFTPPAGAFQSNCALNSSGVCEGDAFVAKLNPSLSGPASLNYFTYLGGSHADGGLSIAIDSSGNAYVTGSTVSADFPVAGAVFQPKFGGGNADAFITKLNPTGTALAYSGYLGGTDTDIGYGIAVDTGGNAYVAGQTCSLDFPLANPEQNASGGNCDAFVSKVSILNGIQLNPAGLVFSAQSLGTTSQSQVITVTNGDTPATLSAIAIDPTSPNPADFTMTTTCAAALLPGGQCTVTVSFTPQGPGLRKASIPMTATGTGLSQSVVIPLNGQASTLTLSASSLSFGQQQVGLNPAPTLSITATNNGPSPVTFTSITTSGEFTETDDCAKAPLQPTTNCKITITFTPTGPGSSIGALTLTDNAPGSPQIVLLTGNGIGQQTDFAIAAMPTSATVAAGNSATIAVTLTSFSGFSQPVTFSCAGLPVAASCIFSPNAVTPSTTGQVTSTLTITTGLRTEVPQGLPKNSPSSTGLRGIPTFWLLYAIAVAALVCMASLKGRRAKTVLGANVALAVLLVACSGSGGQPGVPAGTPAGNSQVIVTGVSGTVTHTATVSLHVK